MAKNNKVYIATVDRFGYDLTVVGRTEKEAKDALIEEYIKVYQKRNGTSPDEDLHMRSCGSYLDYMEEDIEINEYEFGKVEWR